MNAMDKTLTAKHKIYLDPAFDPAKEVVRATKETYGRNGQALFGNIAYLGNGAKLYQGFIEAHGNGDELSDSAKLMAKHGSTVAGDIADISRLIVIGGGSYNSIKNQELALVREAIKQSPNEFRLNEFVLIDVSTDFLFEQQVAIDEFAREHGIEANIISIRSDFEQVSGARLDRILAKEFNGAKPRDAVKAAVISTGATFGNLTNPVITGALPTHDIDVRMARQGDLVGVGSISIFDYFTKMEAAESYYNQKELAEFFENIPNIILEYAGAALENFHANEYGKEDGAYFRYHAKSFYDSRLIGHQLVAQRPQESTIKNGTGARVLTIGLNEKYTMMYSARPRSDDIQSRPVRNTGLHADYYVSNGDLVMHVATKVSEAEVLKVDEDDVQEVHMMTEVPKQSSLFDKALTSLGLTPRRVGIRHGF